ncbi:dihydroorotate dehydrogenase electron transfer subunit [Bacillus taeanensis]|uniref:Dihydroorotate dehydrogenase B (NAD(+)), electron transfer subunit n=1 Tax=Bacillus taeanensis TaxID=273032 RepID=A0A366XQG1_9BACI|nr:dihydroorotate dehydrogenase electron transfer subunit [Bacillus taeanensis]RBW67345.1 dihydroorotate dehydrogenase electron transfer subunit [Bacillus taeanensis]
MKKNDLTVISHKQIAKNIFEMKLQGKSFEQPQPGQFVHVKVGKGNDPLLRRPISVCDAGGNELVMLYRAEGKGTQLLSQAVAGETVDILGPLGNGFPLEGVKKGETALLVGGGIGVPPLFYLSKALKARGVKVVHVLGFQTKEVVFYEEEFQKLGPTYVATVDGTHGTKGFVTDVIEEEGLAFDTLYTCGPNPMLKALEARFHDRNVYLSLEERMGCGIGACFACVCHTQQDPEGFEYRKVCSDGPVFPAGEVIL